MRIARVRVVLVLLAVASLFASACASPPEAEKKAADDAVSTAKSAGAEKYAPSEYSAMAAAVKKADSEMTAKSYKEAKESYMAVKDLADRAAKAAEAGKAALKAEVEKHIADLTQRWQDLEAKAQAVAKKMKADQKQLWDADAKTVADSLEAAKTAVASDANVAKDKLGAVKTSLDKWEGDLAALTAAPQKPAPKGKP